MTMSHFLMGVYRFLPSSHGKHLKPSRSAQFSSPWSSGTCVMHLHCRGINTDPQIRCSGPWTWKLSSQWRVHDSHWMLNLLLMGQLTIIHSLHERGNCQWGEQIIHKHFPHLIVHPILIIGLQHWNVEVFDYRVSSKCEQLFTNIWVFRKVMYWWMVEVFPSNVFELLKYTSLQGRRGVVWKQANQAFHEIQC